MLWTLNDALQECARNTYNAKTMIRTGSSYSGKGLEYATRFLSGINYAINKICRERIGVLHKEDAAIDEYGRFSVSGLSLTCLRVKAVYDSQGEEVIFNTGLDEQVSVDGYSDTTLSILYEAIPDEMTMDDLDVALTVDQRYVDGRVLCQYANYQFLSEEGTNYDSARAQTWLGLYNDSFENIKSTNSRPSRVRYTG